MDSHRVVNCRFATATLFLPNPHWYGATDRPWSCVREKAPRALDTTDECRACPHWEARAPEASKLSA